MTHNVTLPLRSCLHTQLRERERERGERMGGRERAGQGAARVRRVIE